MDKGKGPLPTVFQTSWALGDFKKNFYFVSYGY